MFRRNNLPFQSANRFYHLPTPGLFHLRAFLIVLGLTFTCLTPACAPNSIDHTAQTEASPESSAISNAESNGKFHRTSQYLTMRDGVKIAVDVYLPEGLEPGHGIPTILHQTRYWRAIEYRWLVSVFKEDGPRGLIGSYAKRFLQHGYAWVDVDVRGSGASFGTRPIAYSPKEIQDGAEIVDWIIAQPWSNGKVGSMGISYSGGTAEMLLVNQHPAVKAVAPMYSGFDLYSEIIFPGGIHLNWFTETWSAITHRLDHNRLPFPSLVGNLFVRGVRPVDGKAGQHLLTLALQGHETNWSPYREASGIVFRDDPPPSGQAANIDALSTHTYADEIAKSGAAIYSYSGWFDGGYQLAAIKRYLHHQKPADRLMLGPWDHGGKRQISPYALGPAQFDHAAELFKFFDVHLKDIAKGNSNEPPIRYYTMGEEQWKTSTEWPPESSPLSMYFHKEGRLSMEGPSATDTPDRYQVDPTTGTGKHSRWNTLVGISLKEPYPDRKEQDQDLLVYTSDPLSEALEVTGHPVATVYLSATSQDTNLFVYLEDVTPEGDVHYVTEGELQAIHRRLQPNATLPNSTHPLPIHTFRRTDAAPLIPGEVVPLQVELLPTSYQFKQGHRIRIALAGADKDHFQNLDGPPSTWEVWHTSNRPSHVELPVVP
ncbi:MAG: CocE/NonD family hydrolase [Nitrospirota bacterium]|nr:CocE/NonD family hydrolase [Nitrospirota bacterium]